MDNVIVARARWGPEADLGPPMPGVPDELWLHWMGIGGPSADAYADMRRIERTGVARFGRFSYSYAYHPPSRTFLEGAGQTIGAHTAGRNSRSLGLCLIAGLGRDHMPHLVDDVAAFIRYLIDTGRLRPGRVYPTGGHRDRKATMCPGDVAYAAIPSIRHAVTHGTPNPPPDPSEEPLMVTDQDVERIRRIIREEVGAIINRARAIVVRDPRDHKAWIIDHDSRWHVPDRSTLDALIFTGQVATFDGEIPVADPAWLDNIPITEG